MLLGNIASQATITFHGGNGTPSSLVNGDKSTYCWDDTSGTNEGVIFTFSDYKYVGKCIAYGNDRYPCYGMRLDVDGITVATTSQTVSTSNPWIIDFDVAIHGKIFDFIRTNSNYDQTLSEIEIYESTPTSKVLVQKEEDIFAISGNSLINIGTTPVTKSMFDANGVYPNVLNDYVKNNPTNINFTKIIALKTDTSSNTTMKMSAIPLPTLVKMKTDINLGGIDKINSMTITTTDTNNLIRIVLSNDGGLSWKTYDGTNLNDIDVNNLNDIKTNGINKATFNSISSNVWNNFLLTNKKLRLAYYFEINNLTDNCNIDTLNMNVNMQGSWRMAEAKCGSNGEYSYEYISNNLLKVYLYSANTYKINYPQ